MIGSFMFHQREGSAQGTASNRSQRENTKIILKIIPFYEKGNIPMISVKKAFEKNRELVKKNSRIRETPMDVGRPFHS